MRGCAKDKTDVEKSITAASKPVAACPRLMEEGNEIESCMDRLRNVRNRSICTLCRNRRKVMGQG